MRFTSFFLLMTVLVVCSCSAHGQPSGRLFRRQTSENMLLPKQPSRVRSDSKVSNAIPGRSFAARSNSRRGDRSFPRWLRQRRQFRKISVRPRHQRQESAPLQDQRLPTPPVDCQDCRRDLT